MIYAKTSCWKGNTQFLSWAICAVRLFLKNENPQPSVRKGNSTGPQIAFCDSVSQLENTDERASVKCSCQIVSSEQALRSEGHKVESVQNTGALRQKHIILPAWVLWWGRKKILLRCTAEIRPYILFSVLLVSQYIFQKHVAIKVKVPPLHTRTPALLTLPLFPFSYNMCFIDHKAVTWIAGCSKMSLLSSTRAASPTTQQQETSVAALKWVGLHIHSAYLCSKYFNLSMLFNLFFFFLLR